MIIDEDKKEQYDDKNAEAKAKVENIYKCLKYLAEVDDVGKVGNYYKKSYLSYFLGYFSYLYGKEKKECRDNSAREIYQLIATSLNLEKKTENINISWLDIFNQIQKRVKRSNAIRNSDSPFYQLYKLIENDAGNEEMEDLVEHYLNPFFSKFPPEIMSAIFCELSPLDQRKFSISVPGKIKEYSSCIDKKPGENYFKDQYLVHVGIRAWMEIALFGKNRLFFQCYAQKKPIFSQKNLIEAFATALKYSKKKIRIDRYAEQDNVKNVKEFDDILIKAKLSVVGSKFFRKYYFLILGMNRAEIEEKNKKEEGHSDCRVFNLRNIRRHSFIRVYPSSNFGVYRQLEDQPIILSVNEILQKVQKMCSFHMAVELEEKPAEDEIKRAVDKTVFVYSEGEKWCYFIKGVSGKTIEGEIESNDFRKQYSKACDNEIFYGIKGRDFCLRRLVEKDKSFVRDLQKVCQNPPSDKEEVEIKDNSSSPSFT